MMAAGLLEEVKSLLPWRQHNALQTVGYKELFDHLDGKTSLAEAVAAIKTNTRQYAKRQLTWFKRHLKCEWLEMKPADASGTVAALVKARIQSLNR